MALTPRMSPMASLHCPVEPGFDIADVQLRFHVRHCEVGLLPECSCQDAFLRLDRRPRLQELSDLHNRELEVIGGDLGTTSRP
jgi:hypothetical protein